MSSDLKALSMFGGRFALFLTVIAGLIWALRPDDWNTIDYEPIVFSFIAFLGWVGLEINQYYVNYNPTEHPSDLKLARTIMDKIPINSLYFYENHDFGGSFTSDEIDGIKYLNGFTLVEGNGFHNLVLDKKLDEVKTICTDFLIKIGERGGLLLGGPSYIIMSGDEFLARNSGLDVSEETEMRIHDVINLSHNFASKYKELHRLLLDLLPSAFEEEK